MEEFDLKRFAKLAMLKKVYIIIIMIISIILGVFYSYFYVIPKFQSKTTLLVAQINDEKLNQNVVKQSEITDLSMTSTLLEPYISLIESKKVLKNVITNLNLEMTYEELSKIVTVNEENTAMLAIVVVNEDAEMAKLIANEIANVFKEQAHEIFSITNVNIIDVAEVAQHPYNVNHIKDIVIFIMLGVFISSGFILLLYMLDTTIKEEEDIENELELSVLATIPLVEKDKKEQDVKRNEKGNNIDNNRNNGNNTNNQNNNNRNNSSNNNNINNNGSNRTNRNKETELAIIEDNKSPVSEAIRALRTNVTFTKDTRTILVTSSRMSEGKSYVTSNLSVALAKAGKKILLVDADMRKGRQHNIFTLDNKNGLSDYLANIGEAKTSIKDLTPYIKTTQIPNLHIITSGTRPTNPSELLSPNKIKNMLLVLKAIYDIIIFDGTPTNIVADSLVIAKLVDYRILVTAYKETKIEDAMKVKKNFEQVGAKLNGAILNKYPLSKNVYASSYYYSDGVTKDISNSSSNGSNQNVIKSVENLVSEANYINLDAYQEKQMQDEIEKITGISNDSTSVISLQDSSMNSFSTQVSSSSLSSMPNNTFNNMPSSIPNTFEYKIEKIDSEIAAMKNILMQIVVNQNQVDAKDIELIRQDINSLKENVNTLRENDEIKALKHEIMEVKEFTENLIESQKENNDKIKKFIENYYKNKK